LIIDNCSILSGISLNKLTSDEIGIQGISYYENRLVLRIPYLYINKMMKNFTVTFLVFLGVSYQSFSQNPLVIPSTLNGTNINLTLQNGTHQFLPGAITNTNGANGDILAPTLILNQGDFVNFSVNNQLGDSTTIHWHGLHVAPENDGGPHTAIVPNATWTPSFTILDKAATYWYHPHLHHKTDMQVSKGLAGLIIVKDAEEAALNLPRTYGQDDFPIIIQTKDFDANNQVMHHSNSDDVLMVNATIDPYLDVPSQVVRYRILNGSSQRAFNIGLTANMTFQQIASDGGLLSSPVPLTRLLLAPGERAEILVNFTGMSGQTIYLESFASELPNGIYGATFPGMGAGLTMTGYNPNPLNGTDFNIIKFNVGAQTGSPVTTVPATLATVTPIPEVNSNITRALTFAPVTMGMNQLNGEFLINNLSYNMMFVNYTIPFNNTEIWQLTNNSAISHPFHIHDVQFYILTRNGVAPPLNEQGRKDVVLVKPQETVRFITKFEDFANSSVPYMYHCHLLKHEDGGMMGQFVIGPEIVDLQENDVNNLISIYPNPSNESVTLDFAKATFDIKSVVVRDQYGKEIQSLNVGSIKNHYLAVDVSSYSSGVYYFSISGENTSQIKKFIKL